jgi:type II secretory pathway component PulF
MASSLNLFGVFSMQNNKLERSIRKLAMAGEQAGFSVEQMISLLNAGLPIESLLELIASKLEKTAVACSPTISNWLC